MNKEAEKELAVLIMGSKSDRPHVQIIVNELKGKFGIASIMRIASAHKNTEYLLQILGQYNPRRRLVYGAIADGSNALGAVMETHTYHPVISAPPLEGSDAWLNIYSSINNPSGVGSLFSMKPKLAALAIAKIFANDNPEIAIRVAAYQEKTFGQNERDDQELLAEQWEVTSQL